MLVMRRSVCVGHYLYGCWRPHPIRTPPALHVSNPGESEQWASASPSLGPKATGYVTVAHCCACTARPCLVRELDTINPEHDQREKESLVGYWYSVPLSKVIVSLISVAREAMLCGMYSRIYGCSPSCAVLQCSSPDRQWPVIETFA